VTIDYAYTTEESPQLPTAIIAPGAQDTVVGAVVRLDGRSSFSPSGLDLTYRWSFVQVPIGSQVLVDGFKDLEEDSSVVSFAPDIIGLYVVQLIVNDGSFDSAPVTSDVNTKVVLVPQNRGIVPDMSWVWNFLSDFWTIVEQRERFETIWSSAVQIIAAEQLKLWQYDYNKSIQDIQEVIQKRWIAYEPTISLDPTLSSFVLADDQAGLNASTFLIDTVTNGAQSNQPLLSNLITVPIGEGNFALTSYGSAIATGRLLQLGDLAFTMARSGVATRAVNTGTDGATSGSSDAFQGSAFSAGMAGMLLKILTGASAGTYLIATVTSSSVIHVQTLTGGAVSFPSSQTGLNYSIFPKTPNNNSFFADQNLVPTRLSARPWRFSPTLTSTQYDFEEQGVSPGDILVVQITRVDNQLSSTLNLQVVSVDRGKIGFVFNTLDLVDGTPAGGLSRDDQIKLSMDLQIPGLMVSTVDNSLVYTDQALIIKTLVQSPSFKRQFYETSLTSVISINLGPFSVTLTPRSVIRNSKVLIDASVKSIPSLQEYIKQPVVVQQDGELFQVSESKLFPLDHPPIVVYQNADYIIDDQSNVTGTCAVTSGSDLVSVPFGDLFDRDIREGDTINIEDGVVQNAFQIISVIDPQTLRVAPTPAFTEAVAPFVISRAVPGTFIRFTEGTFSKTKPAPSRLWAEVTFFDNEDSVENNFGVLVGVLRSDLSSVGATISYKNAVAGLMYALTNGPTVANLQLASQILLGLPFTTNAGTIIEIDPSFKTNADGSPLEGRILIAAEDVHGTPLGITNIYFYPQGRQIPDPANPGKWLPADPELSGIAINPATGAEYTVGDHVDRFAALSKGTQVQDYLTTPDLLTQALNQGNTAFAIQRYHSFQLIVNADITTAIDTDLVAQFIRRAKPTYTKLALALSKALEDTVEVEDSMLFTGTVFLHDNASQNLPISVAFDPQSVDGTYLSAEGDMFAYLMYGTDLQTTQGSKSFVSPTGGFASTLPFTNHETNWIPPNAHFETVLQILSGPNEGRYIVSSATSDTAILVQNNDFDGDTFEVQTLTGQEFAIYRYVDCRVIRSMPITFNSTTVAVTTDPIFTADVSTGDWFVFRNGTTSYSRRYTIIAVDPVARTMTLSPAVIESISGSFTGAVMRPGLINQHYGSANPDAMVNGTGVIGQNVFTLNGTSELDSVLFMQPDDVIVNVADSMEYVVVDFDPDNKNVYVQPALASTSIIGRLERQDRTEDTISLDVLDRMPSDSLFLGIRRRSVASGGSGPDLTTTNASATVSTVSGTDFDADLGVRGGDYLIVLEGADATRDIGYGAGIFPILAVSTTSLVLTQPLTVTNAAPGILYGVQRRSSNER